MNRSKFFSTTQKGKSSLIKGENYELRVDLNSEYRDKRKETVKKVIANMTLGKDVSQLFPDVVKNMQTDDLELKKLVYLYLINYAKTQPELVILAVNTFVKDSDDPNPLIRALAIRTMGCLRVEKIFDYLMDPLKKALKDRDPYVRKTGALCVAKLFDLNPQIAIENGLLGLLQDLLSDGNPMVISNSVAALSEIKEASVQKNVFEINAIILSKLLAALNDSTEWGQTCILESLSNYRPQSHAEANEIIERVFPRLQHTNASVVLSAVKVLMNFLEFSLPPELVTAIIRKLSPPLGTIELIQVTLLSSEPEVQYVVLRNINLILQKRPEILSDEVRIFFTKYNDPPYVKLEKLEVIVQLASLNNIEQVLSELKEYASEVDAPFVRKSIAAIGRCAIKIPSCADQCVKILVEFLGLGSGPVVQESILVMKDIFRKFPSKYEGVIPTLCEKLDSLDEPESKAALIWIIGEYAHFIENAATLIEFFLAGFDDESPTVRFRLIKVQLQLITATVKLFLKRPASAQTTVQEILQRATQKNENPDIRDRAYLYWRLLSANVEEAKRVVLAEKPPIKSESSKISPDLLNDLVKHLGTLASVQHQPPSLLEMNSYVDMTAFGEGHYDGEEKVGRDVLLQTAQAMGTGNLIENLLDLDFGGPSGKTSAVAQTPSAQPQLMDLLTTDSELITSPVYYDNPAYDTYIPADSAGGFELKGTFNKRYGLVPSLLNAPDLAPGKSAQVSLELTRGGNPVQMDPINMLQVAVKNNVDVYYFATMIPLDLV